MSKSKPQYQVILDYFLDKLNTGELKPGDRIPTDSELVKQFNVSRITVTRAMQELEYRGALLRAKKRGSYIRDDYNPQPQQEPAEPQQESAASQQAAPELPIIACLLPFNEQLGYDILRGAESASKEDGLYLTFHNTAFSPAIERELIEKLVKDRVQGIVVYPCQGGHNIDLYSKLLIEGFPFVLIDRHIEGIAAKHVVSNNFQGCYELVSHLIANGHKHISYVGGSIREVDSERERYRGYCQALIDGKIPLNRDYVIDGLIPFDIDPVEGNEQYAAAAEQAVSRLMALPEPPTAIVATNDFTAVFYMEEIMRTGLQIPADISITGFDNLSICDRLEVPLTTMEQSFYEMGEQAVKLLLSKDAVATKVVLDTKMIVRKSVGPANLRASSITHPVK